ncbi:MAG: Pr6Pr family membrane protein [Candidatus Nanopelagicales bacterium]
MKHRSWIAVNAVSAWFGVLLSLTLNLSGYYVDKGDPSEPTLLGNVPGGVDTPLERFFDWTTYFTILSNVVVVVAVTALLVRPDLFTRGGLTGTVWRTLRLDSVLMIVITGVLYNLLLADWNKTGWDLLSNLMLHVITPIVTVVVWVVAGPRGLVQPRLAVTALVIPLGWAAYALVRGAAIGAYPYPFLDVQTKGLASVLVFVAGVAVLGLALGLLAVWVDRLLDRGRRTEDVTTPSA